MNKLVFIIHGWDGFPTEGWFPWLKKNLEAKGFQVQVPRMPHPQSPTISDWVTHLAHVIKTPDENTYFVGHSIGCQTILRYLASLSLGNKIGGAVFVAGWFSLKNLETREEKQIAAPWINTPIDLIRVRQITPRFTALFSDNDNSVPQENKQMFEEKLGAKTILEHSKGHFSGSDGITELPSALEAVLEISLWNHL